MTAVAATAAAVLALTTAPAGKLEYAGALLQLADGSIAGTAAQRGDETRFELRVPLPHGAHIVALWHTHPAGTDSGYFSSGDIETANAVGVPSYIRDNATGRIYVYIPHSGTIPCPHAPRDMTQRCSRGSLVEPR